MHGLRPLSAREGSLPRSFFQRGGSAAGRSPESLGDDIKMFFNIEKYILQQYMWRMAPGPAMLRHEEAPPAGFCSCRGCVRDGCGFRTQREQPLLHGGELRLVRPVWLCPLFCGRMTGPVCPASLHESVLALKKVKRAAAAGAWCVRACLTSGILLGMPDFL